MTIIRIDGVPGSGKTTALNILVEKNKINSNAIFVDVDDIADATIVTLLKKHFTEDELSNFINIESKISNDFWLDFFSEEHEMNKDALEKLVQEANEKSKHLVLVGCILEDQEIMGFASKKYFIQISPEKLYNQLNSRTLEQIKNTQHLNTTIISSSATLENVYKNCKDTVMCDLVRVHMCKVRATFPANFWTLNSQCWYTENNAISNGFELGAQEQIIENMMGYLSTHSPDFIDLESIRQRTNAIKFIDLISDILTNMNLLSHEVFDYIQMIKNRQQITLLDVFSGPIAEAMNSLENETWWSGMFTAYVNSAESDMNINTESTKKPYSDVFNTMKEYDTYNIPESIPIAKKLKVQ
jgi:shikimate kinase